MKPTKRNIKAKHPTKKTLDIRHLQFLDQIQNHRAMMIEIKAKIASIEAQLLAFSQLKIENRATEEEIEQSIAIFDEKLGLEDELKALESKCDETSYLTSTANILYKYYDLVEKGDNFDTELMQSGNNSILKYFASDIVEAMPPVSKEKSDCESRGTLLDKYLSCTDANHISMRQEEKIEDCCTYCSSTNITVVTNDGFITCNDCHSIEFIIVDHDKPSYRDPPMECTYFAYKRHNHFNEWIAQVQGKETTEIPDEVYDKILLEIKKQKITNMAELTHEKVREILKRLRINKYYEHSVHILHRLNGCPMPNMPPELEEKLRSMFKQIQTPFLKHSPADRKNFLSYSYVLHKMMQLLEKDEYLVNFPLLKCREKLHKQDMTWKKICDELGWQFIASL